MPSELQLSDVLSEFARTMVTDFPIQSILDHLVVRIVDVLPVTAAGVTLITPDLDPRFVAASDESALRYEKLQSELGEGPCLEAYREGVAVMVADLRSETRFPRFTPRALAAGLGAVFTFPLHSGDERLGALDLYRDTPGELDDEAMGASQTLADVTAAYLLNAQARSDLREASELARESSLHDPLTGLPNRVLLMERLDHAILRARRSGKLAAVLYFDLDGFKQVNDEHGHKVGDDLLVDVAKRLTLGLRSGDTLGRLAGDEFVILCEDIEGPAHAEVIAHRLRAAMAAPFRLDGLELAITASVGIAFSGPGDQLSESLLEEADIAMYQAKRRGGARHQVVDVRERNWVAEHKSLEQDLEQAMTQRELSIAYQPIVSTIDGHVTGAEALLRWFHPSRGVVSPAVVIPAAEKTGLIQQIGAWVLGAACSDRRVWLAALDTEISVNVSAHQLMAHDFTSTVAAVLADTQTEPRLVTLEITERAFVQDGERALLVLRDLKQLGVKLALDDFGSGYSSLDYLKTFPMDIVKIDRTVIAEIERDEASRAIVGAVVELAHTFGMTTVAEGVESAAQHARLVSLGCDSCQGYFFGHPMPVGDLGILLSAAAGRLFPSGRLVASGRPAPPSPAGRAFRG